jgi:hypothetical protein
MTFARRRQGREWSRIEVFKASMPPMPSQMVRGLRAQGLAAEEASTEAESRRREWLEWDRAHGPSWRLLHDHVTRSDRERLNGMTVDDVLDDGVPPDPPQWAAA